MAPATKSAPALKVRPIGDKVLIKRDEAETQTEAGIYLPESAKDKPRTGTVKAVGTGATNHDTGEHIPMTLKVGDKVIFSSSYLSDAHPQTPENIKIDDQDYLIMSEEHILAVFD